MTEIDFRLIAPRCGGQREAFEELCCQLARRIIPSDAAFISLHGAGGDGGVECFADYSDGRVGWQAKYVFDIGSLLTQATGSLNHCSKYSPCADKILCLFPFRSDRPNWQKRFEWPGEIRQLAKKS